MKPELAPSPSLAAAITQSASRQTYYTIRFFADRGRAADAYRAYAYFRWVDDVVDADAGSTPGLSQVEALDKIAFVNRQQSLLEACYRGEAPVSLCAEEEMLADLIRADAEKDSGLQSYLRNMMAVMAFDAQRRGRLISQAELSDYTRRLATAVTDALHHFIGHAEPAPRHTARYLAVTAAHITHMLRDAREDAAAGYFNIPAEYLQAHRLSPQEVDSRAYRRWVCGRVQLARRYFQEGRAYLAQVKNWRCRLAGHAYTARFEWVLGAIERDHYCLRSEYRQRKSLTASLWMGWSTLASLIGSPLGSAGPARMEES
jgi:phytoene/squalene synthetase